MGDVVEFRTHGAPDTAEAVQEHLDDTEAHSFRSALHEWANNGQLWRVKEFHELTAELLAKRGELEVAE